MKAGVNEKRRAHMRELGKHSCFRLRQSTSLFIDEYDDKVQKVVARDSSVEAIQRRMMAQMGEDAFWKFHARQFALMQAWQQVPGVAQGAPPPGAPLGGPAPGYGTNAPVGGAAATATATAVLTATAAASGAAPQPSGTGTYVVYPFPPPGTASAPPGYGPPGYPPGYGNPGYVLADPEVDEEGRSLKKLRRGNILLGVGGGLLGLGAISAGVAAALTSNESTLIGGLFVWTLAGVLGLGGIGLLIAGGIIRARA